MILVVDDDPEGLNTNCRILSHEGYQALRARDGQEALSLVRQKLEEGVSIDVILSDIRMPKLSGLDFLRAAKIISPRSSFILMTAYGELSDAVWALKMGAIDFLSKPFKRDQLLESVRVGIKKSQTALKPLEVRFEDCHRSVKMREIATLVSQVANTRATILITGESGTGKEVLARKIHEGSERKGGPFVAINCAAIPENLLESELFGYERGSFTGAQGAHAGLIEQSSGGTIFLDEIGDMPLSLQAKILRVLQDGEIRRIGANSPRSVDLRVVAATNQDLKMLVQEKKFREDLLFRLEVIAIAVPPLRDRIEDLEMLALVLIREICARHGLNEKRFTPEFLHCLKDYHWPGNIRELRNVIERAVLVSGDSVLLVEHLVDHLRTNEIRKSIGERSMEFRMGTPLREIEETVIRKTLEATNGDRNLAAKILGVHARTISRKIDRLPNPSIDPTDLTERST